VTCEVLFKRGSLCLSRADCERCFSGVEAVVLLRDGPALLILPVRHAHAGGYLLKQRNLAGDRAAHVAGFLRDNGFDDSIEVTRTALFEEGRAALVIDGFFEARMQT
jgi:hypothetical protein